MVAMLSHPPEPHVGLGPWWYQMGRSSSELEARIPQMANHAHASAPSRGSTHTRQHPLASPPTCASPRESSQFVANPAQILPVSPALKAAFLRLLIQITCILAHLKGSKNVVTFRRGGERPGLVEVLRGGEQGLHRLGWTQHGKLGPDSVQTFPARRAEREVALPCALRGPFPETSNVLWRPVWAWFRALVGLERV